MRRNPVEHRRKSVLYHAIAILVLFYMMLGVILFGCSGDPRGAPDLGKELDSLQADIRAAVYLRRQALGKVEMYYALGAVVAKSNPALERAELYEIGRAILEHSTAAGLSPILVLAIIDVESKGHVYARSYKGALGLMQVMPYMALRVGVEGDLFVVDNNIRAGTLILADNIERLGLERGIQAYFWGKYTPDGTYLAKVRRAREAIGG